MTDMPVATPAPRAPGSRENFPVIHTPAVDYSQLRRELCSELQSPKPAEDVCSRPSLLFTC